MEVANDLLKEAFQQLWDYNSPAWAGKFLDEWCRQTMRSRIEPMKKIARSLREHRELILNYFRAQKLLSSGVVEGLNNKAKVTMRKSYGFRTFRVPRTRALSLTWQAARAGIHPRFLLTSQKYTAFSVVLCSSLAPMNWITVNTPYLRLASLRSPWSNNARC